MSGGHFTHYELTDFARGEKTDEIDTLVEHLKRCRECGDQLAVILALTSDVERPALMSRVGWVPPRRALQALVAAAAVVAAALLLYPLLTPIARDPRPAEPPTDGREEFSSLATTEPPPLRVVQFQLGIASPVGADDTDARLQQAGVAVAEQRYDAAISELEALLRRRPSRGDIAAYLGIALYLSGDDSSRVGDLLATASTDRNQSIASFAQWYHANFLLRVGQIAEAIRILEALAPEPVRPGRNAADLLARMGALEKQ